MGLKTSAFSLKNGRLVKDDIIVEDDLYKGSDSTGVFVATHAKEANMICLIAELEALTEELKYTFLQMIYDK